MEYEVLEGWERLPEGWSFVEVAGVAVDSRDRAYVFNRGDHPIIVFDKEGQFRSAWGGDIFTNAHGIYIDEADVHRSGLVHLASAALEWRRLYRCPLERLAKRTKRVSANPSKARSHSLRVAGPDKVP